MSFPFHTVLVTGGAGFIGSTLAIRLRESHPDTTVVAVDNLVRRGSEHNLPRLRRHGVRFLHGDVRSAEDLAQAPPFDLLIDCASEPAVAAAESVGPRWVVANNLLGTANCLEVARQHGAGIVFLSTSRVYPIDALNALTFGECPSRFELSETQTTPGASGQGVSARFPLAGRRSLYGATKLASELLLAEYGWMYGLPYVIDRCGVIAGPWQMARADQGVFTHWVACHHFGDPLAYVGWGGRGKQVRDILHVDDLVALLLLQGARLGELDRRTFNVGGGKANALSLAETTNLCRELVGREVVLTSRLETRDDDVRIYISDDTEVNAATGWSPRFSGRDTLQAIAMWLAEHGAYLRDVVV